MMKGRASRVGMGLEKGEPKVGKGKFIIKPG